MQTIHELTKVGGIIYHDLPMGGYHTHGYFCYNPIFFRDLAAANSYEIVFQRYSQNTSEYPAPDFMRANGYPSTGWLDAGIEFIWRKAADSPFRMPLETGTSLGLNPEVWRGADPYGRVSGSQHAGTTAAFHLMQISGWDLQRELIRRYRARLKRLFVKS